MSKQMELLALELVLIMETRSFRTTISVCPLLSHDIDYYGQGLAIYDCHHQRIGKDRWVGFVDIDEFVLPRINMTFSLREILSQAKGKKEDTKGIHSSYMFANNFVRPGCLMNGLETLVPPRNDLSLSLQTGDTRGSGLPPYLYTPVRDLEIYKFPRRSKVILDPISTSFHGIHIPGVVGTGIVDEAGFGGLIIHADFLWKLRYPEETRSFFGFLKEYERRVPKSVLHVEHELAIMSHVRWSDWEGGKAACKRGEQVIDFTLINLWHSV
jgi:hypothetical protein